MAAPLVVTKYRLPPAVPNRVERARLFSRLDELLAPGKRMALVSAPAGSGKTTLVRAWRGKSKDEGGRMKDEENFKGYLHPHTVAWVSLDEEDNDPATYLSYLSAALQDACPEIGLEPLDQSAPDQISRPVPPIRTWLAGLVNRLAELPGLTILVLDDYHVITNPAVHECNSFLIDRLPERVRLVIVTRADALLPVSRLRARGQLVELRETDLRFTPDETAAYLNDCMGLKLAARQVEALAERTEGWAAGLQMAALALRSLPDDPQKSAELIRGFSGSHRFVLDYLLDEVFSRLPAETRDFLLKTSILERMCAPLCAALGESPDERSAQDALESLERSNLFLIPLDGERRWYRYHHLFAGLLRSRAGQALSPDELAGLHRRAAAWFTGQGLAEEAIQHALQGGNPDQAAGLMEQRAQAVISAGRQITLQRWLAALPAGVLQKRPKLRIFQAWASYIQGDSAAAIQILEETGHSLQNLPESSDLQALKGELISILAMSSLPAGDSQRVIRLARDALERMPQSELTPRARLVFSQAMAYAMVGDRRYLPAINLAFELARQAGNHYLAAGILFNRAFGAITFSMQLHDAWQTCHEILDLYPLSASELVQSPAGLGLVGQAGITLEWNDLETASQLLERGMDLCRQGGITIANFSTRLIQARLSQARGDLSGAAAALTEAAGQSAMIGPQMNAALLAQAEVRLRLARGDLDGAERWARGDELAAGAALPTNLQEIWEVCRASVRLAQGQPGNALALLERLIPQAEAGGRLARVFEGSLIQALALHALERDALAPLRRALALGRPQGVTRMVLEAGPPAQELLTAYRSRLGELSAEADRLLHLSGATSPGAPSSAAELVEQLTPREMDVLRLLYAGHSNQEIADALFLSLSAVKKYTGSIYGKLGVSSRAQAIAKARELRLV